MSIDPTALNAIHLVRDKTSGSSRSLAGPIKPRWLTLALPKVGKHRGWIDHVVEGVLCEIINAYRVKGTEAKPFWRGPAYQMNRRELAARLDCRLRDISTALVFLEKNGLVTVHRKARYLGGEPRGRMVYAIPNVEGIDWMLTEVEKEGSLLIKEAEEGTDDDGFDTTGTPPTEVPHSGTSGGEVQRSVPAKSGTQAGEVQHNNLNVPNRHNDDVGHAARQVAHTPESSHRHLSSSGAGGGAAADPVRTSPPAPVTSTISTSTTSPAHTGQRAAGPASAARGQPDALVESKISRFINFWSEAGRRSGYLDLFNVAPGDRKALREFFTTEDVDAGWLAAVAIRAWQAGGEVEKDGSYDPAWACRRAKDIQSFLRLRCRILSELGANKYKVNAYKNLRGWFTDSELRQQGFDVNVGLGVVRAGDCWESDPDALDHYKEHGLEIPPEVSAAANTRSKTNGQKGTV